MSLSRRNFLEIRTCFPAVFGLGPQQQAVPAGGHSPRNLVCRLRCLDCCKRFPRRPIRHVRARRSGHHLRTSRCGHLQLRMSDCFSKFGRPKLRSSPDGFRAAEDLHLLLSLLRQSSKAGEGPWRKRRRRFKLTWRQPERLGERIRHYRPFPHSCLSMQPPTTPSSQTMRAE